MTLIRLTIIADSKKNVVKKIKDDVYEVHLKAEPVRNQANEALIPVLAAYFSLPTTSFTIISGHHTRHKRVEIHK